MSNFSFDYHNFDLWPVYDAIRHYYPIGIKKIHKGVYYQYSGIQELEKKIIDTIHNKEINYPIWEATCADIGRELNLELIGTTYGQAPSFSAFIPILAQKYKSVIHSKELHLSISLLGPFLRIYGRDSIIFLEKGERIGFDQTNIITVSPLESFESYFTIVETIIQNHFSGYKIIPYNIGKTVLDGLQVTYTDDKESTINMALFNNLHEEDEIPSIRGDVNYGMSNWEIK